MSSPHDNRSARRSRWLVPLAVLASILILTLALLDHRHTHSLTQYKFDALARSLHQRDDRAHSRSGRAADNTVLTLDPTRVGGFFAPGAVGLSIEMSELATRDVSASHQSLVELMRLLGPAVLRLGGDSVDHSWWTSANEPAPAWATSTITPADLVTLRELLTATGWRAILGVDLGHFAPKRAANEARFAKQILGPRLLGIEIGNEPNGYGTPLIRLRGRSYGVQTYLKEVTIYAAAIARADPGARLFGPELSAPSSWLAVIAADPQDPFAVLTEHYYPTSYGLSRGACQRTLPPTALQLLSPQVREQESELLRAFAIVRQSTGDETRISETNTTASCDTGGGPATSPVFASSLWALDWVLRAASAGVTGLNFHGYFGTCTPVAYSPICAPNSAAEARGAVAPRPEYYGLLAARQLEDGRFISVTLPEQERSAELTAYATVHPSGVVTLAIDNFAAKSVAFVVVLPGYEEAKSEELGGPSLNATAGVTFGQAAFSASGLRPVEQIVPASARSEFPVTLAPTSGVVITLQR
jgi:hypothetical protein